MFNIQYRIPGLYTTTFSQCDAVIKSDCQETDLSFRTKCASNVFQKGVKEKVQYIG